MYTQYIKSQAEQIVDFGQNHSNTISPDFRSTLSNPPNKILLDNTSINYTHSLL